MGNKTAKIKNYVTYDLWRKNSAEMGRLHRFGVRLMRTIVLVIRSFGSKALSVKADHLTYSLLFAIVPILAMILAVAKGFGFAELIEAQLLKTAAGKSEIMPVMMDVVHRYLDTSAEGAFIGIGIIYSSPPSIHSSAASRLHLTRSGTSNRTAPSSDNPSHISRYFSSFRS